MESRRQVENEHGSDSAECNLITFLVITSSSGR
jgi:hypothetical protein